MITLYAMGPEANVVDMAGIGKPSTRRDRIADFVARVMRDRVAKGDDVSIEIDYWSYERVFDSTNADNLNTEVDASVDAEAATTEVVNRIYEILDLPR